MSGVAESLPTTNKLPTSRAVHWCLEGLRLWRLAPFRLFLLSVVLLLVEGLLQLIPWVGVTLSKVAVPVLQLGILLGLAELARGGRLRWSCLLDGLRRRRLLPVLALAAMWGLGVFVVQQGVAWLVYGWPAVDAVWLGHLASHPALMTPAFNRWLLLPGLLPSTLMLLAPCLFLFDGRSPWQSIRGSARMVLRHSVPFAVLLLVNLSLFLLMLATSWSMVLVLLLMPWSVACTYAVWSDVQKIAPGYVARG